MSLIASAKTLVRTRLPKPVWLALKTYGLGLLEIGPPSLQMYVHEHGIESFVGLNNYFSTLAAEIDNAAEVELVFYDAEGRELFTHAMKLAHFGSQALDVGALLRDQHVESPRGLVSVRMTPVHRRHKRYQDLGLFLSQFFMFYRDAQRGSVAHIHPSSQVEPSAAPSPPFLSSQIVSTRGLDAVVLYQCNPSPATHSMTFELRDAGSREPVASAAIEVPALGVRRIELTMASLPRRPERLLVWASGLPSGNSKPMLQRRFSDGRFTMSHS